MITKLFAVAVRAILKKEDPFRLFIKNTARVEIVLLFASTLFTQFNLLFAQIPNSGFETWENYADDYTHFVYEKPDHWVGSLPKNMAHSFSITKNPESYPVGTGQYSMKIQSDSANGVAGVAGTDDDSKLGHAAGDTLISLPTDSGAPVNGKIQPSFAINKRPTSLNFYCKCSSFDGDTINCQVYIYKDSTVIGYGVWATTQSISNWTALEIPVNYKDTVTVPDSATIFFMTGIHIQHSQSYIIVDNLSFNTLITSVTADRNPRSPHPGSDIIKLFITSSSVISFNLPADSCVSLKVFDLAGREMATLVNNEILSAGTYNKRWERGATSSGVYVYRLRAGLSVAAIKAFR